MRHDEYMGMDPERVSELARHMRHASNACDELAVDVNRTLALADMFSPESGRLAELADDLTTVSSVIGKRAAVLLVDSSKACVLPLEAEWLAAARVRQSLNPSLLGPKPLVVSVETILVAAAADVALVGVGRTYGYRIEVLSDGRRRVTRIHARSLSLAAEVGLTALVYAGDREVGIDLGAALTGSILTERGVSWLVDSDDDVAALITALTVGAMPGGGVLQDVGSGAAGFIDGLVPEFVEDAVGAPLEWAGVDGAVDMAYAGFTGETPDPEERYELVEAGAAAEGRVAINGIGAGATLYGAAQFGTVEHANGSVGTRASIDGGAAAAAFGWTAATIAGFAIERTKNADGHDVELEVEWSRGSDDGFRSTVVTFDLTDSQAARQAAVIQAFADGDLDKRDAANGFLDADEGTPGVERVDTYWSVDEQAYGAAVGGKLVGSLGGQFVVQSTSMRRTATRRSRPQTT